MKNDLLSGNPAKSVVLFALPIMLSSLLQYSYNFVDNIIVGQYVGTQALAAVGNIGAINSFIIGTALGLTSGFTIPVAQKFGAGEYRKMNNYAGNSITLSLVIGVSIVVVAHIISNPILRLINTPDDIFKLSADYINILYFGVPIQMLFNNFTGIARSLGDSKRPLYFLILSVLVNLALDILLVGKLGLGVANATFVSQNYGAGKYERIIKSVNKILILDLLISVFCSAVLIFAGPYAVRWFVSNPDAQMVSYAKQYLYTIGGCYALVSMLFVFRNTLQGLGFTYANAIAGVGELLGRMLVSFLLTPYFGFAAVCFAGPVAWLLADLPLIFIYLKKKRMFKSLIEYK